MGKKWGKILRRELLPQFLTDSHEIWHRCLSYVVDVQDTFFASGKKCVAMVTAYYGQKMGGNFASRTTSSVFDRFSWNLAQMFVLGCRCARHIFRQWQKVRCHGNGILWAKNGEILRRELLPQILTDSHGIWHRCLPWGVDVQDIFFDSGRNCVAMVTAYYGQKIGGKSCVANYFFSFWPIFMEFGTDVCLGV